MNKDDSIVHMDRMMSLGIRVKGSALTAFASSMHGSRCDSLDDFRSYGAGHAWTSGQFSAWQLIRFSGVTDYGDGNGSGVGLGEHGSGGINRNGFGAGFGVFIKPDIEYANCGYVNTLYANAGYGNGKGHCSYKIDYEDDLPF